MKSLAKRLIAMVLMVAVCLGVTAQFGVTHLDYKMSEAADAPVMMTVNGEDVKMGEYAGFFAYCRALFEQYYGAEVWSDPEAISVLIQQTDSQCVYAHVILQKCQELGIKLDRTAGRAFNDAKATMESNLAAQGMTYDTWLSMMGLTEDMYKSIYALIEYSNLLDDYYFGENGASVPSETELRAQFDSEYLKAKHILITNTDDAGSKLTGDALAAKEALIKEIQSKLAAGEDFDSLMKQYSEDPGLATAPDGYVFTEGDMVTEFYDGAKALKTGEISDIVPSDFGWHIIRREAMTDDDYAENRQMMAATIAGTDIDTMINDWISAADVTYADGHEALTIEDVLGTASNAAATDGAASSSAAS